MVGHPRYTKEEIAARGKAIYEQSIRDWENRLDVGGTPLLALIKSREAIQLAG